MHLFHEIVLLQLLHFMFLFEDGHYVIKSLIIYSISS